MSNSIENSDSTWLNLDIHYYLNQASTFTKEVIREALPGVLAAKALASLAAYINPSLLFDDELSDPEGESFLVTRENKSEIASRIIQDRVSFSSEITTEQRASYQESLHSTFVKMLGDRMDKIDTLAQKMGIARPVQYAISMPATPSCCPYQCIGDKFSPYDPVINANISEIKITNASTTSQAPLAPSAYQARQEFILAHEMSHIARGDWLVRVATISAVALLNIGLWINGLGGAAPLLTKITGTFITAFCIHAIARLFYIAVVRYQERKADQVAMNTLGSSEGAEVFFSSYKDNPCDLEHPPISSRLLDAQAWRATH